MRTPGRALSTVAAWLVLSAAAVAISACGSGEGEAPTEPPSGTPTPTPWVRPTVTPFFPVASPGAGKPPTDIFTAPVTGISDPELVRAAYAAAYAAHPEVEQLPVLETGEAFPEQYAENNLNICLFGHPPPVGSAPAVRGGGCQTLVLGLLSIYDTTGEGIFYQAAVVAWDFAVTTLPDQVEVMTNNLRILLDRREQRGL